MAIQLQPATIEQADEISDLDCAVFPEEGIGPSTVRQELTVGNGIVAVEDETIVGFALVRPGTLTDLTRFGVRESHRRRGIAKMLLEAVLKDNPGRVMLLVRKNNQPAIDLYRKAGFTVVGMKESSWLMIK